MNKIGDFSGGFSKAGYLFHTQHFTQQEIDEYREAFYLYAPKGVLDSSSHLRYIMRCIGYSPTQKESQEYFKQKRGRIDYATFLDVLHEQSKVEHPREEILAAFRADDTQKTGMLRAKELRSMLVGTGERISEKEVARLFVELGVTDPNAVFSYDELVNRIVPHPKPDYD